MNKRRLAEEAAKAARKRNGEKFAVGVAVLLVVLLGVWKFANRQNVQATQLASDSDRANRARCRERIRSGGELGDCDEQSRAAGKHAGCRERFRANR